MKVHMNPGPRKFEKEKERAKPSHGIRRVVEDVAVGLEARGWNFVGRRDSPDIVVSHACSIDEPDVIHCHGLHPTAERDDLPPWAWQVNKRVLHSVMFAKATSVPSPWVARIFQRDLGFTPYILPHGIHIDIWKENHNPNRRYDVLWNKNRNRGVCDVRPLDALSRAFPRRKFISTFASAESPVKTTGIVPHDQMMRMLYDAKVYLATTKETFGIEG